jgi:hypothetical protein
MFLPVLDTAVGVCRLSGARVIVSGEVYFLRAVGERVVFMAFAWRSLAIAVGTWASVMIVSILWGSSFKNPSPIWSTVGAFSLLGCGLVRTVTFSAPRQQNIRSERGWPNNDVQLPLVIIPRMECVTITWTWKIAA